jgi:hypothetical protein
MSSNIVSTVTENTKIKGDNLPVKVAEKEGFFPESNVEKIL